jgi:hypothetical protein
MLRARDTPSPTRAARVRGQASLELLAALPLLAAAALLAWQLVAVLGAAATAQERARAKALAVGGPPGRVVTVSATVPVPAFLPGAGGLAVSARAAVRTP